MLSQKLPEYGITPILVPEVATLVLTGGIKIKDMLAEQARYVNFQRQIILTQLAIEENFEHFAELQPGARKVLICDRGAMDGAAYLPDKKAFEDIVEALDMRIVDLRDGRYDAVFHLVTAANGAEKFYTLANNAARHETADEARLLDVKTQNAWNGHEHLKIFPNYKLSPFADMEQTPVDFETKIGRLLHEVCAALRIPAPVEVERKFLAALDTDPASFPLPVVTVEMCQTYLRGSKAKPGVERRVRRRTQNGGNMYTYTEKQKIDRGARLERERIITQREYEELYSQRDQSRKDVLKRRHSFIWKNQYFQLDKISSPQELVLLEVEVTDIQETLLMPPFIRICEEVTENPNYKNASIALGTCPGYIDPPF